MIGLSNSGSKTCRASENDPSEARGTPSFFRTDFNSDACDNARIESTIGLKKNSSTKQQYSSKCRSRLPAMSRSQPTSCSRSNSGSSFSKYFSPVRSLSVIFGFARADIRTPSCQPDSTSPSV